MRHLFAPVLFLTLLLGACSKPAENTAAKAPAQDFVVVPGERIGLLKPAMAAEEIASLYGAENLVMTEIPIAEGATLEGAKLFPGTDRELELIWRQGESKKILSDVNVIGPAWTFSNGLKSGMTLLEVERLNGKPFKISGFDWDYGGYVTDFEEGKLGPNVGLRFSYGDRQVDTSLIGERSISTTDAKLRELNPILENGITVNMTPP